MNPNDDLAKAMLGAFTGTANKELPTDEELDKLAHCIYTLFSSYVKAGFSEEQALYLVSASLQS